VLDIKNLEGDQGSDDHKGVHVTVSCVKPEGPRKRHCRARVITMAHDGNCEPTERIRGCEGAKFTDEAIIFGREHP